MNEIKSKLMRYTRSRQFAIEVTFPDKTEMRLWDLIIEHCSKDYSNNELSKIWRDCNEQLKNMSPNDIPLKFKEMMTELSRIMIHRKIWIKEQKEI